MFVPGQPKTPANRIIGIFHSMTLKKYKGRVMDSFKVNSGNVRIVIASSALGMGVNFPDVHYVIHLGPAWSIVDHVQQSGRAGRDGKQVYNVVIASGQKLAQCETAIKNFARTKDCLRKALMQPLDVLVESVSTLHNCCSNCKTLCRCNDEDCSCEETPFAKCAKESQPRETRVISKEDESVLEEALKEFQSFLNNGTTTLLGSTHAFTDELIKEIVSNAGSIFNLDDIISTLPVFSTAHAHFILDIFQDIFGDIVYTEADDNVISTVDSLLFDSESNVDDNSHYLEKYFDSSDSDSENPELPFLMG